MMSDETDIRIEDEGAIANSSNRFVGISVSEMKPGVWMACINHLCTAIGDSEESALNQCADMRDGIENVIFNSRRAGPPYVTVGLGIVNSANVKGWDFWTRSGQKFLCLPSMRRLFKIKGF